MSSENVYLLSAESIKIMNNNVLAGKEDNVLIEIEKGIELAGKSPTVSLQSFSNYQFLTFRLEKLYGITYNVIDLVKHLSERVSDILSTLPKPPAHLIGHDDVLSEIQKQLVNRNSCCPRRDGKSSVALKYAKQHHKSYDSIVWIPCSPAATAMSSLRACAGSHFGLVGFESMDSPDIQRLDQKFDYLTVAKMKLMHSTSSFNTLTDFHLQQSKLQHSWKESKPISLFYRDVPFDPVDQVVLLLSEGEVERIMKTDFNTEGLLRKLRGQSLLYDSPNNMLSTHQLIQLPQQSTIWEWLDLVKLYDESLAITVKVYGTQEHAQVAVILNNMELVAYSQDSQGEYAKAMQLYEESLATYVKVYGTRERDSVATTLHSMSVCKHNMGYIFGAHVGANEALQIYRSRHSQ
ncbi:hypothetical protein BJ742DRAFT_738412 [Cladochytrium replicatum]|nr:hypothetical protein BJ742DRAFT_738412 [Cladochytrium replicatum]